MTHNFLIGWFVSQALGAPPWRWMGLNQMNCALTVIACLTAAQPGAEVRFPHIADDDPAGSGGGGDVVVHAEEVAGVVLGLETG